MDTHSKEWARLVWEIDHTQKAKWRPREIPLIVSSGVEDMYFFMKSGGSLVDAVIVVVVAGCSTSLVIAGAVEGTIVSGVISSGDDDTKDDKPRALPSTPPRQTPSWMVAPFPPLTQFPLSCTKKGSNCKIS